MGSVQDLVYITADAFTQDELISMEIQFLSALEFRVSTPTAAHFFDRVAQSCDERQRNLALYLLELSLTDYRMSRHLPSHVAAASLVLANRLLQVSPEGAAASISEDVGESVYIGRVRPRFVFGVDGFSRESTSGRAQEIQAQ